MTASRPLIGAGADVNMPTPEGVTPLMIALDNDHNDVAKLLLDRGANPAPLGLVGAHGRSTSLSIEGLPRSPPCGRSSADRSRAAAGLRPGASRFGPSAGFQHGDHQCPTGRGCRSQSAAQYASPQPGGNSGRFIEEFLNTGCTPLMRATIANDMEVVRTLLDKGASPNICAMGLTPFLVAAGVGTGGRGTGLAASTSAGGAANMALMDLLLEHGADVNAQVTGTKTYSLRISRAPSSTEGMTALHVAAQGGKTDVVRYLLDKGAKTDLVDSNGRKPIDLAGGDDARAEAPCGKQGRNSRPSAEHLSKVKPAENGSFCRRTRTFDRGFPRHSRSRLIIA